MFLSVDGERSRISHSDTSQGATMSSPFLSKNFSGPCTTKDMEMKAIASTAKQNIDNQVGRRRVGPTYGFVASPEVGLGATVDTLWTKYPYIKASSQDKL
jgi:hypothetical protein